MNKVGRPSSIIELNLNDIEKTINHVMGICKNNNVKKKDVLANEGL